MAIYLVGFEGGTVGGAIGTSGGDASPAFDAITAGFQFDNTHVHRGSLAALIPSAATGTIRARWNNGTKYAFLRGYIYIDNLPSTDTILTWTADVGAGTASTRAYINVAGKIRLGSKTSTNILTHTVNFPINQFVRLEHYADAGTSAADGKFQFAYYLGESTTPEWDSGLLTTNVADATGIIGENRFGFVSTGINQWYDSLKAKTGADAVWGIDLGNARPTVIMPSNQNVAASAGVSLTATPSDSDGTVASRAWTLVQPSSGAPTLTGATTDTLTFTAGAAGNLYTLQYIATDNDGTPSLPATVEVRVPQSGPFSHLPVSGTGDAWVNIGGASTDGQALSDGSDTTYLESPGITAVATTRRVRVVPIVTRTGATFTERFATSSGTANLKIRLYEGNTLREEFTQAITTTPTNYTFTLATGTISAIGDWGNLFIEVAATT